MYPFIVSRAFSSIAGITVALTETTIIVGEDGGSVQICVTVTNGEVASDFPDDAIIGLTVRISSTDSPVPGFAATGMERNYRAATLNVCRNYAIVRLFPFQREKIILAVK